MSRWKPNDLVMHETAPGVRGIVLGYQDDLVMVCWETGYEPYTLHREATLEEANVLDLLCEGRESEFRFEPTYSRCKCGRKLVLKGKWPFCTACNEFFNIRRPKVVACRHEEDHRACPFGCSP